MTHRYIAIRLLPLHLHYLCGPAQILGSQRKSYQWLLKNVFTSRLQSESESESPPYTTRFVLETTRLNVSVEFENEEKGEYALENDIALRL